MNTESQFVRDVSPDLPEELVDQIVSRLPSIDIFKIKCVCQRLRKSPEDGSFQSLCVKNGPRTSEPEALFLLCRTGFDDVLNQSSSSELHASVCLDLAKGRFLSLRVRASKWREFPASVLLPSVATSPVKLLCSAAGLVLTGQGLLEHETLSVINPLTRSKREISSRLEIGYRVRQLVMDDLVEGRYMIFADNIKTAFRDVDLKLRIYDSITEQWTMDGTLRTLIRCPLLFTAAASLHGKFYCLAITLETAHMYQFDLEKGWRDSDARVPPSLYPQQNRGSGVCKPHLFRHRSDLMLAGVTLFKYGTKSRYAEPDLDYVPAEEGVHLWKLDERKMKWKYEKPMPEHMFNKKAATYEFLTSEEYLFVNEVMPREPKEPKGCSSSRRFLCQLSSGLWDDLPLLQAWDPSSAYSFQTSALFTCTCTYNGPIVYEPRMYAEC